MTERARMLTPFLCFAQRGLSLHERNAKNILKSNIAKEKK
jgi:hypothetical protein